MSNETNAELAINPTKNSNRPSRPALGIASSLLAAGGLALKEPSVSINNQR